MQAQPIRVLQLLPKLERKLLALLRSLDAAQWSLQALPQWTVKDIVAHLVDGNLRRLSMGRDGFWGETFQGSSNAELVTFLNALNADWVKAFRRLSPTVLIELLEFTSAKVAKHFASLDPDAPATFPVGWAGHSSSPNWFDIAREYTERWHHQQQIRDAVGQPGIMSREFYYPLLSTFMYAFPPAYNSLSADEGATVMIRIKGRSGGQWFLTKSTEWQLSEEHRDIVNTEIIIPEAIAWKVFTKALTDDEIAAQVKIKGDKGLAEPLTRVVAVMK
jgi:uncharacterized protein (TIGR03083 family)